jgi:CMP-N,N'-diacetyllegionaminic acid synthase
MKNIYHSIILARGDSKGIKNKNLQILNGKPLIYWSIKKSLECKKISKTWVSSDSEKILNLSKNFGANIIKRPRIYSKDSSSSESAWEHAIKYINKEKIICNHVVGIQPTSPLRDAKDFERGINIFEKNKLDSLFTSLKINDYFIWFYKKKLLANYDYSNRPRRQIIEDKFLENGSFYIFSSSGFLNAKCRLFGKIGTYKMSKIKSFQVDDKEDLEIIKKLSVNFF